MVSYHVKGTPNGTYKVMQKGRERAIGEVAKLEFPSNPARPWIVLGKQGHYSSRQKAVEAVVRQHQTSFSVWGRKRRADGKT